VPIILDIYDPYNNASKTVNGQAVTGPLKGYRNLRFVQRGAIINEAGSCTFDLPMALRNNLPIGPRTMVRITDTLLGLLGTYMVGERSETPADDSRYASFTCLDQVNELTLDTVPGLSAFSDQNETTAATLQRILNVPYPTSVRYTGQMVNGTDYYAGIDFLADNVTVQAAFSKLLGDRGFGWRRGEGRVIEYGTFKRPTTIRLVQASMRPSQMNRAYIRPIPSGGLRTVIDPTAIYNCIAITGAGSGPYQHSLQPLYNIGGETQVAGTNWWKSGPQPIPGIHGQQVFAGFDPNFPIHRRITYNGRGSDGYEYFLVDMDSVNRYRSSFYPLNRSDVGSTDNAVDDMVETAQALYVIAWATLKLSAKVNTALSVTTIGRGDNRGIGGDLVTVEWRDFDEDNRPVAATTFDRVPFVVLGVETAVDDSTGAMMDTWSLSDIGRAAQTDVATQTGMLESIAEIRNAVTIYPVEKDIHRDEPIGPGTPVIITINMSQRYQKVQVARWSFQLTNIYSTVTGGDVELHSHSYEIPGLNIDAGVPPTAEKSYNPTGQYANHTHTENISANRTQKNFTDGITAGRSQGVTKGGSVTGGGDVGNPTIDPITTAIQNHNHSMTIVGGGPPTGVGDNMLYVRDGNVGTSGAKHFQVSGAQFMFYTNYPGNWTANFNHGHTDTFGVTDGLRVDDNLGVSRGGTLTDDLGVSRGGTFNAEPYGLQPDTNFPGHINIITSTVTKTTTGTKAPGFTPKYGKFFAPSDQKPQGVTVKIGGSVVLGPFNADQIDVDLHQFFQTRQPVTMLIESTTVGRIIVDGLIEASKTIYGYNST